MATTMPVKESMETAAMAMPYTPAQLKATMMPAAMTMIGRAVDFMETPRPAMMLVACPVVEAWATCLTG